MNKQLEQTQEGTRLLALYSHKTAEAGDLEEKYNVDIEELKELNASLKVTEDA